MIDEYTIEQLSRIFCGDTEDVYKYKTGPDLIQYFNAVYGFSDKYVSGFPTRWKFAYDKIVDLINTNRLDEFITNILSIRFIMQEHKCTQVQAHEFYNKILFLLNDVLAPAEVQIMKRDNKHFIIEMSSDLVLIGHGGFANVYKQKSTGLAIKKLKEDLLSSKDIRSRFKREYEITKSLSDLFGIIKVHEFNNNDCTYTMDLAEQTFENYIDLGLTIEHKITAIQQILYIMTQVHKRGIVHRDISPSNIFLMNGQITIADFGLGKDINTLHTHQTIGTNAIGQLRYCAPEQTAGLIHSSKQSDVYSLGKLINYVLTDDPNNTNHFLKVVVEKSINVNPIYRYTDASELYDVVNERIAKKKNSSNQKSMIRDLENGKYNNDIATYIYGIDHISITMFIIHNDASHRSFMKLMTIGDDSAMYIVESISKSCLEARSDWSSIKFNDYDIIASFSNKVLLGNFSYIVKSKCCDILTEIAYSVNRLKVIDLIKETIAIGIEPLLEEKLTSGKSTLSR